MKLFIRRHKLRTSAVQKKENGREKYVRPEVISEHIARVAALVKRFNITSADHVFNMDQSGSSISKMVGREFRMGIADGSKNNRSVALKKTLYVKGSLDRVTVMTVVSASGVEYKPCVIYPGKQPQFSKVQGKVETPHDILIPCYLFYNETSAANYSIILE